MENIERNDQKIEHTRAIEKLLVRVRGLNKDARARLGTMLDDEMDLPYLDVMEREYAKLFQTLAPDQSVDLRGRFVKTLNEQREYLVGIVRNVLQEPDENALPLQDEGLQSNS